MELPMELPRLLDLTIVADYKEYLFGKIDEKVTNDILAGFTFEGKVFSMSWSAQINWSNLHFIPEGSYPININTKDDVESYSLTYANKDSFYGTALTHKMTCLYTGNAIKEAVRNSTTIQELDTIKAENNL